MKNKMVSYLFWGVIWFLLYNLIGIIGFIISTPNPLDYALFNLAITLVCLPLALLWCAVIEYIKHKK
jgi:hypothetical protein